MGKGDEKKRKPKLTYVSGLDGRRYVNDKILRNLESSQGNRAYSDFVSYNTVSNCQIDGYLTYEEMDEQLTAPSDEQQQQGFAQTQASFDQQSGGQPWPGDIESGGLAGQGGFSFTHSKSEENIVAADLQAAFERASGKQRSVHTTVNDMAPGAFQAQAYNEAPQVGYDTHGYADHMPQESNEQPDINTTYCHGQGRQQGIDPAYEAVFGENAAPVPYVDTAPNPFASEPPKDNKDEYKRLLGGLFKEGESPPQTSRQEETHQEMKPHPSRQQVENTQAYSSPWAAPPQVEQLESNRQQSHQIQSGQQQAQIDSGKQQQQVDSGSRQAQIDSARHYQAQTQSGQQAAPQETTGSGPQPPVRNPDGSYTTLEPPKPKFEREKPPLPRRNADEIYFEDNANSGKTAIFKMPKEGVVKSSRGTVELLVHKGGRMFRPHYNPVGILLRVDVSDGFSLIKGEAGATWQMTDREGNLADEEPIQNVAFDKKGNLWYETTSSKKTRFLVDGSVEVTMPGGKPEKL